MPNYKNGKIYKIVDLNEEMIYVGSTTQTLAQRMSLHRNEYKAKPNTLTCHLIFEKYGIENCKILLLELCSCNSKEELHKKEGEYIKTLICVNKLIAGRTIKEYYNDNKEHILEYKKQYYNDNKEQKLETIKQYDLEHKKQRLEYNRQYYLKKKFEKELEKGNL